MIPASFRRACAGFAFLLAPLLARGTEAPVCLPDVPAPRPALRLAAATREPLDWSSLGFSSDAGGQNELSGDVTVRMGQRLIEADDLIYDANTNSLQVNGHVRYADPQLRLSGESGRYGDDGGVFRNARFELVQQHGRGSAETIDMNAAGLVQLHHATYTTCPAQQPDWALRARLITLDTRSMRGTGRDARVDFRGIPLLYIPWISFPLNAARQSGFLFPEFRSSSRGGLGLATPWYWNLAPDYDLTFTPTLFTRRGIDLGAELRFLSAVSRATLYVSDLPHDRVGYQTQQSAGGPQTQVVGTSRRYLRLADTTGLPDAWRLSLHVESVSDVAYFEDFSQDTTTSSTVFLPRFARLSYRDDVWHLQADVLQMQILDPLLIASDRPYAQLPRFSAVADWRLARWPALRWGLDSEAAYFTRADSLTGWRADARPHLGLQIEQSGFYLHPQLSWEVTAYGLDVPSDTQADTRPGRSVPSLSVDSGLNFERLAGSTASHTITLEPRVLYVYTPFREQSALPVFDSALADPNLVELFRANRYVGIDRISDANDLAVGLTTRIYSSSSGTRYLSMTIGQRYAFSAARVVLPGELPGGATRSDLITQVDLTGWRHWNAQTSVAWDPGPGRAQKAQLNLQYLPAPNRVANLGYRYERGQLQQVDGSVAWPVNRRWDVYARSVYSLFDHTQPDNLLAAQKRGPVENFLGAQYRGGCFGLRLVLRRSVSTRTGVQDTGILLQLELNGLSSVGTGADTFLEHSIRGYSASASSR